MRGLAWLLAGVVLGFVLGGVQPRRELAALQDELQAMKDRLVKAERRAGRRLIPAGLPGLSEAAPEDDEPEDDEDAGPSGGKDEAPPADVVVNDGDAPPAPDPAAAANQDPWQAFDAAVDAQRVRAKQSRAALQEQADLSDEQMAEVDRVMADMNRELMAYTDEMLTLSEEDAAARDALGLAHDVTGVLYDSQTALEEIIGEGAVADVDEQATQVWNYVDLDIFRGALEERGGPEGWTP